MVTQVEVVVEMTSQAATSQAATRQLMAKTNQRKKTLNRTRRKVKEH